MEEPSPWQRLSLAAARAAEKVSQLDAFESLSSAKTLAELVEKRLHGRSLLLASNREPYTHTDDGSGPGWYRTAGGLTTALDSMAAACHAKWVCQGSGDADWAAVQADGLVPVPPDRPSYKLRRLRLSAEEERGFYEGFSNETLWPLCHVAYVRPRFDSSDWQHYQAVNLKFAQALAEEAPQGALVFLQDYHLALTGKYLKELRPDLISVLFWHIPWPNTEIFRICPWKKELLEGLLGNDILGFHLPYHAQNFIETVAKEMEVQIDVEKQSIQRQGASTKVRSYPISIDFEAVHSQAASASSNAEGQRLLKAWGLEGVKLGLGVDRLDYTKGIPERLLSLERFFDQYPEWIGRFTFVQIGVPSRTQIEDYRHVVEDIERRCESLNARYSRPGWKPVILQKGHHDFDTLVPMYKLADVCVVSSLHDGMNLVAKEFVAASSNDKGVLILSPFTGAARELEQALVVNPYDGDAMAAALQQALNMLPEEQAARMKLMRRRVAEHNIFRWAESILRDVAELAESSSVGGA